MGHPDRKALRERKREKKEKMLSRRNLFNVTDLTPQNAVGKFSCKRYEIKYK